MSVSSMDEKKASSIKEINQVDTVGGTTSPSPYTQIFQSEDVNSSQLREKRFLRKVDLHILTFLVPMYLFNILDRSNLAQARLGGLEKDLGMKGTDFNLATSILFVGYLTMQLPSNLILTRIRPSLYLGLVMAVWGAVSACTALVHSFGGLMAVRIILGIAEAPFFSGAIMLMSSWYTRGELAQRISWFYSGNALANMFGGLLAAGVLGNLDGAHGIEGWRWLFIIEGVITIGIALAATLVLPNYPATTKWLSEEEKAFALWRLACDVSEEDDSASTGLLEGLKMSLKDYKLYLFILLQHVSLITQTFQYFFPSIVKTLGYGNIETLLLTVSPNCQCCSNIALTCDRLLCGFSPSSSPSSSLTPPNGRATAQCTSSLSRSSQLLATPSQQPHTPLVPASSPCFSCRLVLSARTRLLLSGLPIHS